MQFTDEFTLTGGAPPHGSRYFRVRLQTPWLELRQGVALVSRPSVPLERLGIVLGYALSQNVENGEVVLCGG